MSVCRRKLGFEPPPDPSLGISNTDPEDFFHISAQPLQLAIMLTYRHTHTQTDGQTDRRTDALQQV